MSRRTLYRPLVVLAATASILACDGEGTRKDTYFDDSRADGRDVQVWTLEQQGTVRKVCVGDFPEGQSKKLRGRICAYTGLGSYQMNKIKVDHSAPKEVRDLSMVDLEGIASGRREPPPVPEPVE